MICLFSLWKRKKKTSRSQDQKTATSRSQDQKATTKQSPYGNEIRILKNHGIEIRGLKRQNIEKREQLNHDIVILRHFFRRRKTTQWRFQDWKTTTLSFCGFLTLMPPDRCSVFFSSAFQCSWFYNMPIQVDYTEFAESAQYLPFFIDKRTA